MVFDRGRQGNQTAVAVVGKMGAGGISVALSEIIRLYYAETCAACLLLSLP